MRHANAMRLHGVARDIGIVSHIGVVEVSDFLILRPKEPIGNRFQSHVAESDGGVTGLRVEKK